MAMIKCPYCGNEVSDKVNVCIYCGSEIKQPATSGIENSGYKTQASSTGSNNPGWSTVPNSAQKKPQSMSLGKKIGLGVLILLFGPAFLKGFFSGLTGAGRSGYNSTNTTSESRSITETAEDNENAADTSSVSEETPSVITGTYVGKNGSVLVLYDDGKADYYWKDWEEAESGNTWTYRDGVLCVNIPEMYGIPADVTATAQIVDDDTSSFVLSSDSANWDDEEYVKVRDSAEAMGKTEFDALIAEVIETGAEESEVVEESGEATSVTPITTGGVDPDLKAFLDSYEAFVDEYVAFMKQYMNNPANSINMLNDYMTILERLEDFEDKVDRYDTDEMSVADAAYYLEVTTRCYQKMLTVY